MRSPTRPRMSDTLCGASMTTHFGVVADHPEVVVDLVGLAVEGERAGRVGVVDPDGAEPPSEDHDRAQHVTGVHLLERGLSTSIPISPVTKASRSSRPCW